MEPRANILVVEDEPLERQAMATLLRVEGYEAFPARGMREALDYLNHRIDVVVSDLLLQDESGIDVLRAWKRERPDTPFIIVSAVAEISRAVEAVKEGAEDYITKPFRPEELLARIAQCVEMAHTAFAQELQVPVPHFASRQDALRLDLPADASMEEIERAAIERALQKHQGNRTRAAHSLGISVRTLQRKLKAWNMAEINGSR